MKFILKPQRIGQNNDAESEALPAESIDAKEDWLYAAYFWVAGAIAGNVSVKGLDLFEDKAEKSIIEALQDAAAIMSIRADFIRVKKGDLRAFQFDLSNSPNLYLPLIVLAAHAQGTSVLSGLQHLKNQQDNTWEKHFLQLKELGLDLKIQDELLLIKGGKVLEIINHDFENDEELFIAALLLGLNTTKDSSLKLPRQSIKKYPNFITDFNNLLMHKIVE